MHTPIDTFFEWFEALPPNHRQEIAFLISFTTPGFETVELTDRTDILAQFESVVRTCQDNPHRVTGMAICLRSAIDFFIVRHREHREDWDEKQSLLEQIAADAPTSGIGDLVQGFALRREQWIRTCDRWKTNVRAAWTDEALYEWDKVAMRGTGSSDTD